MRIDKLLPGNADQCRINAARYIALSKRAWRPEVSQAFRDLAQIYSRLAAENDADGNLYRALCDIDLSEPHDELPRALNIYSWAA
jgi:hypothetical protein